MTASSQTFPGTAATAKSAIGRALTPAAGSTDRQLGALIAMGGAITVLAYASGIGEHAARFPVWWNAAAAVLALSTVGVVIAAKSLPLRVLRVYWLALPLLAMMLQLATFAVLQPGNANDAFPWVWYLEPVFVASLILVVRTGPALGITIISGLSPGISALLMLGQIPLPIAAAIPVHLGNVVFVVLFAGIRARLVRLRAIEAEVLEAELRRNKAVAEQEREAALSRLIHDEVLSVLGAAALFQGQPPAVLRQEACKAKAVLLDGTRDAPTPNPLHTPAAGVALTATNDAEAWLLGLLGPVVHGAGFESRSTPGALPTKVVENVGRAAAEALRNSRRHAGVGAKRSVEIVLSSSSATITVGDDGVGFDPSLVPPERFGLRESIHGCMHEIGGTATVCSKPGEGATVRLKWVAP